MDLGMAISGGSGNIPKMELDASTFENWTPEQIAQGKVWVAAWQAAGRDMEQIRRAELRHLDPVAAIALLCGPADYRVSPRAPKPTSGLVEQQRWFMKASSRD